MMELLTRRDWWILLDPYDFQNWKGASDASDFLPSDIYSDYCPFLAGKRTRHSWPIAHRKTLGFAQIRSTTVWSLRNRPALRRLVAASEFERRHSAECLGRCS